MMINYEDIIIMVIGWKEGSLHYLVGTIDRQYVYTDEQKYRCFVYQYSGKQQNKNLSNFSVFFWIRCIITVVLSYIA